MGFIEIYGFVFFGMLGLLKVLNGTRMKMMKLIYVDFFLDVDFTDLHGFFLRCYTEIRGDCTELYRDLCSSIRL